MAYSKKETKDMLLELFKKIEYTHYPDMTLKLNLAMQFTDYALYSIIDDLIDNDVTVPVYCKYCKDYEPHGNGSAGICQNKKCKGLRYATDFCSYGEVKERES